MKTLSVCLALFAALLALLVTGCGGGTSVISSVIPVPTHKTSPTGEYYKVGVIATNQAEQPVFDSTGNTWNATITDQRAGLTLVFDQALAGTRHKGGPRWSYSILSSVTPQNWTSPEKDILTFNQRVVDIADTEVSQHYNFLTAGRYMVEAFDPNTKVLEDIVFLNINTAYPQPKLTIEMTVAAGLDAGTQDITITIKNTGDGVATSTNLMLGPNYDFVNSIEARVGPEYGPTVTTGPVQIRPGLIYQLGSASLERKGTFGSISDAIATNVGFPLNDIAAGETIVVRCRYIVDQNAPGLGFSL